MEIGRKIYYEKATGNVITVIGERVKDVRETTQAEDFASYKVLTERVPETVDVIKLEYGQYAQDFRECNGYRVNLDTLAVEFSYPDPNDIEPQEPVYQKPLSEEVVQLKANLDSSNQSIAELTILVSALMM